MSYQQKPMHKAFHTLQGLLSLTLESKDIVEENVKKVYAEALAIHDHSFEFSDDHEVWIKGKRELEILRESKEAFPFLLPQYETYWKALNDFHIKETQ